MLITIAKMLKTNYLIYNMLYWNIMIIFVKKVMKNIKYKSQGNFGLFDEQETYQKLSEIGNPLEKISSVIA